MSIAADPRYRAVSLQWLNNGADGDEKVQMWAKPAGGSWSITKTFAVVVGEQPLTNWDTALPLTAYDVAFRFTRGNQPAVGYELSPDFWTAGTAAQSKSTVTTGCAAVIGARGTWSEATQKVTVAWTCAQTGVVFLLEKDVGAGWVTVATDISDLAYTYTPELAELHTTIQMRVTVVNGALTGPTSGAFGVACFLQLDAVVIASGTFNAATAEVSLTWGTVSGALSYTIQKSQDAGATWATCGSSVLSTHPQTVLTILAITASDANLSMKYRMFAVNGGVTGALSNVVTVATTITIGTAVLTVNPDTPPGFAQLSWTPPGGNTVNELSLSNNGGATFSVFANFGVATLTYGIMPSSGWTHARIAGLLPVSGGVVRGSYSNVVEIFP